MEAPSLPGFQLDQTFFGFKPEHRLDLHDNLFNLIWHGEGRWDWDMLYNMPIFLRRFYTKRVNKLIEDRNAQHEAAIEKAKNKRKSNNIPKSPF
jgi:hypothetical protein